MKACADIAHPIWYTTSKGYEVWGRENGRLMNSGGSGCTPSAKCSQCEGDCDRDGDCSAGLRCFQRQSSSIQVPGCDKGGSGDVGTHDYCYAPANLSSPRLLTAAELASAKCERLNGHVSTRVNSNGTLDFWGVTENAESSAVWVCDLAASQAFESVQASYTLLQMDPVTGKAQDPDDNSPMTACGPRARFNIDSLTAESLVTRKLHVIWFDSI